MKITTKQLILIALMADVIAVCSWITVPFVVPFTLQTMGVFLALRILGGKQGTVAVVVYIVMGAFGLPVFSGFSGGLGHLLGPTGGYILGFLLSGILYILLEKVSRRSRFAPILCMVVALLGCYAAGTVWFSLTYGAAHSMSVGAVLMVCVVPFILPDLIKIVVAETIAAHLKKLPLLSASRRDRAED